jgi:hypothetical protein
MERRVFTISGPRSESDALTAGAGLTDPEHPWALGDCRAQLSIQNIASWNRIADWLRRVEVLREAA